MMDVARKDVDHLSAGNLRRHNAALIDLVSSLAARQWQLSPPQAGAAVSDRFLETPPLKNFRSRFRGITSRPYAGGRLISRKAGDMPAMR